MRKPLIALLASTLISANAYAADVPALSGGTGAESRALIEEKQAEYSTKLVFIGVGGIYLSGVAVSITGKNDESFVTATTEGPILLANLPAGKYKLKADAEGHSVTRNISVKDGQKTRTYHIALPIKDN